MTGRWQVRESGRPLSGRPWLVLRADGHEALLWNGPVLELSRRPLSGFGPDILADPPDLAAMVANLAARPANAELGDALLDQRLVAGIGNLWRAEALWQARLSPWLTLAETSDEELERVLREAAGLMRASLEDGRPRRAVYRRSGRPCPRCGEPIRSRGQGEATASPTGVRVVREERSRPARNSKSWPCAPRTSTTPCAASAWRRSRCSPPTSTPATRSRSRSRSTRAACTNTGRCSARTSRRGPTGSARSPMRGSRSRSSAGAGRRGLRRRARRQARGRGLASAHDPAAAAFGRRRGGWRLGLAGRLVRPRLFRLRGDAARGAPPVRGHGAADGAVGRRPARARGGSLRARRRGRRARCPLA